MDDFKKIVESCQVTQEGRSKVGRSQTQNLATKQNFVLNRKGWGCSSAVEPRVESIIRIKNEQRLLFLEWNHGAGKMDQW